MKKYRQRNKRNKFKFILSFILIGILAISVIALAVKLNESLTTKQLGVTDYSICSLDNSTGEEKESELYIVSDYFTVDGLKCELKKDAEISYKLFFYKADKTFVGSSEVLEESTTLNDLEFDNLSDIEYVRVQIQPIEDSSVSLLEVVGYSRQLTVSYNK